MKKTAETVEADPAVALESLLRLLVKSGRASTGKNPYLVPEITSAMKTLAQIKGIENWMDALDG